MKSVHEKMPSDIRIGNGSAWKMRISSCKIAAGPYLESNLGSGGSKEIFEPWFIFFFQRIDVDIEFEFSDVTSIGVFGL